MLSYNLFMLCVFYVYAKCILCEFMLSKNSTCLVNLVMLQQVAIGANASRAYALTWGKCVDLINAYKCLCLPGYTGSNCMNNIGECQRLERSQLYFRHDECTRMRNRMTEPCSGELISNKKQYETTSGGAVASVSISRMGMSA